ncbi:ATP-binding response regulator [Roseimaritima ulvae]|uniref:Luminescence regulatory protein LuxO n=1 Tax=Roseimaritima ulvae TaxID=980254 RepID=A0A5B9QYY2_9BACT|nr:response regulator [Roseimaritima ulvae]QEG42615.1 Luminescence regulatory protein LuxO [Roseimaritima ulvae]
MTTLTRVLVAEDSPTQAFQIRAQLEEEGYEVHVAQNGQIALQLLDGFQPHLILTDMEMPVLNGLELVTASRAEHPAIPIILITAQGNDESAIEALQRGAAAYLPKSQLADRLLATIDQVLDLKKSDRSYAELLHSMEYNEFRFALRSDAELISPLVELMQQMTAGVALCDETGRVRVGMALDCAIRNAMFHGNLELSREQLEADRELVVEGEPTMLEQRLSEKPYCDRQTRITLKLTPEEARIVVRDEGPGFDTSIVPSIEDTQVLNEEWGRGLVLIRSFMDEVTFNDRGNEITMVKRSSPTG